MTLIEIICALVGGYVIGILQKGVHVHITKKEPEPDTVPPTKVETSAIPNEILKYAEENNGQITWGR